jgi:hypothetical protein
MFPSDCKYFCTVGALFIHYSHDATQSGLLVYLPIAGAFGHTQKSVGSRNFYWTTGIGKYPTAAFRFRYSELEVGYQIFQKRNYDLFPNQIAVLVTEECISFPY